MARTYIDNDMAHFVKRGRSTVDMELFDGRRFENLQPKRLFPLSGLMMYITLLDADGVEAAIIRDLASLPKEERDVIEECLDEYYFIPKITRIDSLVEKFGLLTLEVMTDKGPVKIEARGIVHSFKLVHGSRVLIRDTNDNRYEIPDLFALDRRSQQIIDSYL